MAEGEQQEKVEKVSIGLKVGERFFAIPVSPWPVITALGGIVLSLVGGAWHLRGQVDEIPGMVSRSVDASLTKDRDSIEKLRTSSQEHSRYISSLYRRVFKEDPPHLITVENRVPGDNKGIKVTTSFDEPPSERMPAAMARASIVNNLRFTESASTGVVTVETHDGSDLVIKKISKGKFVIGQ